MFKSRLLSLIVAGFYLLMILVAAIGGEFEDKKPAEVLQEIWPMLIIPLIGLACIWYGDHTARFMMMYFAFYSPRLGRQANTVVKYVMACFGWIVLLVPLVTATICWLLYR